MKIRFTFLFIAVTLALGCQRNEIEQRVERDITPSVYSKLSNKVYKMRGSSFQMTGPDRFKFYYDADVTLLRSMRSRCELILTGKVTFKTLKKSLPGKTQFKAYMEIDEAKLIKSHDSHQTCVEYKYLLKENPSSEHWVHEIDEDYLSFSKLRFDIDYADDKSNIAQSRLHHNYRDFTVIYNDLDLYRDYFVVPGKTIDLTESILSVIQGKYSIINIEPQIEMDINKENRTIIYKSDDCNFTYLMEIKSIYTDSENTLAYQLEALDQAVNTSESLSKDCVHWNQNIVELPNRKSYFGLRTVDWPSRKYLTHIFMLFPSSNPRYYRVEMLKPVK